MIYSTPRLGVNSFKYIGVASTESEEHVNEPEPRFQIYCAAQLVLPVMENEQEEAAEECADDLKMESRPFPR